jgi:hypothetical protein
VDLAATWKQLGIESDGKTVHLNDEAPLAAIRRSITSVDSAKSAQPTSSLRPSAVFAGRSLSSPQQLGRP